MNNIRLYCLQSQNDFMNEQKQIKFVEMLVSQSSGSILVVSSIEVLKISEILTVK